MKHKITFFAIVMMAMAIQHNVFAYDFSDVAPSGQTLYYKIVNDHAEVVHPGSGSYVSGDLVIPSSVTYNGYTYPVTVLANSNSYGSFQNCSELTFVYLPSSITLIGNSAFSGCSNLNSVYISGSITSIGSSAFFNCTGLTSLTLPSSVISIGSYAFYNCNNLSSFTIPDSIPSIGSFAFTACSSLSSITIPDNVTEIGYSAFAGCTGLTSIVIPDAVIVINDYAFAGCSGLTSVTIGNGVTTIGEYAFSSCGSLDTLTMGGNVTSIGDRAFNFDMALSRTNYNGTISGWCNIDFLGAFSNPVCYSHNLYINNTEINDLSIPSDVSVIKNNAFNGCQSLTSVFIPGSVISIGEDAFALCTNLSSVEIENGVVAIGDEAFASCGNLTSIFIPNSVTSIGNRTFTACSGLVSIFIGNGILNIGNYVFRYCNNLSYIHMASNIPPQLGLDPLFEANNNAIVYIPCGSMDSYTTSWSYFNDFVEVVDVGFFVASADTFMGYIAILSQPTCQNSVAVFQAIGNEGFAFIHWNDGSTENPRTVNLTQDASFTAYFAMIETDTLYITDTLFLTDTIMYYVDVPVHDTTYVNVPYPVHDTTYINVFVHDTTYVNIPVHDTTFVDVPYFVHDTTIVTEIDTVIITIHDTVTVYQTDTLWMTQYDTVYIHDTVIVGIDEVEAFNAKIYQRDGQIVVESDGTRSVRVFDVAGREMTCSSTSSSVSRQAAASSPNLGEQPSYQNMVTVAVPAAGVYLVKIGELPARKVVVVR